jgi:hypothetical protein
VINIFRTSAVLTVLLVALLTGCPANQRQVAAPPAPGSSPEAAAAAQAADAAPKLEHYLEAAAASLDPRALAALSKIEGTARRLLAVRGYLRGEALMVSRWSWTAEEIKSYEASAEHQKAMEEVEKVRRKFSEQNPGYEIYVNTQVRTLERQIQLWNETKSVETAAGELVALALSELAGAAYNDMPSQSSTEKFRKFLQASAPVTVPTVATPGLSAHGQLRAFDFQIQKEGQIVAGTESASIKSIWEAQGWEKRLKDAVSAGSSKFQGPLQSPREPWHYNYVP